MGFLDRHSSFCSSMMAPTRRLMAASLGKVPMTSMRRLISPFSRSIGLVECSLVRCGIGKPAHRLDLVHWPGEFWDRGSQLVGDFAPLQPGCSGVVRKAVAMRAETWRRPFSPAWASA
jgi:hypothetical protein